MSERSHLEFSRPQPLFQTDPEVYSRILELPDNLGTMMNVIHVDGTPFARGKNPQILEALGDYKDQIIDTVQELHQDRVGRVEYFINRSLIRPDRAQITVGPHTDGPMGGIALLSASILPTVLFTRPDGLSDAEFNPNPYLIDSALAETRNEYFFDEKRINEGVRAGQLEKTRLGAGEVFELGNRVHMADINRSGKMMQRVFIAAEITMRGDV